VIFVQLDYTSPIHSGDGYPFLTGQQAVNLVVQALNEFFIVTTGVERASTPLRFAEPTTSLRQNRMRVESARADPVIGRTINLKEVEPRLLGQDENLALVVNFPLSKTRKEAATEQRVGAKRI
jgi:hypothetical protein